MPQDLPSVSGFPYDIFISYAHNDNQQVNEEIKGWVELFYNSLEMTLRQRLGKKRNVKIWWDQRRLKANTKFDHSIAEGVEQAAIMICLNSQSLIDSDYCQLERAAFVKKSEEDPVPLVLDHQSRMIPVHLYRLHFEDWPEEFDGLTGLPIYEPDRGGMSYPMLPRDTKFIYRIRDLAEETVTILENIATLTETLQGSTEKQDLAEEVAVVETTEDHRGTLFIGEESRALRQTKIQLIEALRKRGYTILPKEPLPFERIAHETAVRECLAKADASIHLMGRKPGEPFDEDDQVFPNLEQIRWAQEANLQPLVWLPDGLTLDQVSPLSYQTFLRQLEQGSALSRSYRLEWAPPEELVSLIDDHFAELKASRQFKGKVLVDLHAKDQPEVLDLLKWMDVQGIDYWLNPVEEEPGKRLALLEEAVSKVGQLIFICGYAQKAWVESRLQAVCQLIIEQNLAPKDLKVLILPPEKTKEAYDFSDWHFLNLEVVDHSTSQELQPTILEQLKIKSSSIPVRNSVEQAPKNPYVGLRPFDEEDSLYFFGRRQQIIELLDRLYQHRFLAVVGASGSGKSSLIRAGLIPLLRAGYLAYGNQGWEIATLKPGQNPRRNLVKAIADSLQSLAEAPTLEQLELDLERDGVKALIDPLRTLMETQEVNFFLLVDQFEELFRFAPEQAGEEQAHQNAEAQLFISLLLDLAQTPELPLFVTITMRSDFLGDCARYIRLTKVLNASQYLVPRLSAVQRQQAITGPARLSGTPLDAALTETLLEENPSNQDQLPVLQHALNRMWVQVMREGMARPIGVEEYERVGGLENALSLHLDELMAGLPDDDVQLTLRLFQLLTSADKAGRRTRRPARRRELATQLGQTPEGVNRLLKPFMPDDPKREQAFVLAYPVADDPTDVLLDISHESLIRQWKTLESFSAVNTNQAEAAFQRLPDEDKPLAAALFRALVEQDPDGLHYRVRPTQVQQLAAIMDQAESTVNRLIDYFIQAQNNLLFRTEIPSEPDNPRIELGGDEVILAWPLLKQWAEKEVELQGRYWELLQQAEAHDRGEAGLLQQPYLALVDVWVNKYSANAAWANRIAPGWERAYNYLEDSLAAEAAQQEEIKRLRRRQLASLGVLAAIVTIAAVVAFILMGQARDETARAEASEQKSETITNAFRLLSQAENELQETANVGLFLAKVALDSINKDTTDENATNLRSLQRGVYDLVENSLFFSSPFLQDTLTYYATAHQWDLGFRQGKSGVLRNRASKTRQGIGFPFTDEEYIDQVFVAPNGSSFVVTFWDHAPQWRDSTGALLGELNINDSLDVKDVVFSQDSDWVMIGTAKRLWRCNRGQEADFFAYLGGSWFGELSRLALHPEERFIATASTSGYVGVWSMSSQRLQVSIPRDERVSGEVMALRFSEAGTHLLVGGQAGLVRRWSWNDNVIRVLFNREDPEISAIDFTTHHGLVAIGYNDGWVELYYESGAFARAIRAHGSPVTNLSFARNGRTLTSACYVSYSGAYEIREWQLYGMVKAELMPTGEVQPITSVVIPQDRAWILLGYQDGAAAVYNWQGQPIQTLPSVRGNAKQIYLLSEDGSYLLRLQEDLQEALWELTDRTQVGSATITGNWRRVTLQAHPEHTDYVFDSVTSDGFRVREISTDQTLTFTSSATLRNALEKAATYGTPKIIRFPSGNFGVRCQTGESKVQAFWSPLDPKLIYNRKAEQTLRGQALEEIQARWLYHTKASNIYHGNSILSQAAMEAAEEAMFEAMQDNEEAMGSDGATSAGVTIELADTSAVFDFERLAGYAEFYSMSPIRITGEEKEQWDQVSGIEFPLHQKVWAPDTSLLAKYYRNVLYLWNQQGLIILEKGVHDKAIDLVEFSKDGHEILTVSRQDGARIWWTPTHLDSLYSTLQLDNFIEQFRDGGGRKIIESALPSKDDPVTDEAP